MAKNQMARVVASFAVAAMLLLSTGASAYPTSAPETKQVGATAIVYRGDAVDLALSYKSAKLNPGGRWLFLDVVMSAAKAPLELPRTAIAIRTPSGQVVPLASQQELGKAYSGLAGDLLRDRVTAEPLGYLTPRRLRRLGYFSEPGRRLAFASAWLDEWHNSIGRLFFQLPDGVQKGSYELLMNLHDGQVTVPFTI